MNRLVMMLPRPAAKLNAALIKLAMCCLVLTHAVLIQAGLASSAAAEERQKPRLVMKANDAGRQMAQTEAEQLQKARAAAADTATRETDVLKRQQQGEWQAAQRDKASAQFNERESREQKYLREAKEAAQQQRKIPKP